ncbi:MAG TPA: pyridoxal phosphate-dependent aminotransferase [Candidatus Eisenbacteria bacterium]|nr:pyridoxal phosphate-dependent aminotransferase [Candidatus Eisenbacteria bacterium]
MGRLTTAASFDMLARGRALEARGRSIVHLGIGEPDFDTPANIRAAADAALAAGWTHYGPAAGLPEFRALVARTWAARRGLACGPENVVVTPGAKPVLFFAMLALLEPGDEVLIPSPAFPTYASVAAFLDARVVPVPLDPKRGFDLDPGALRARLSGRSRILVLNSPHNPTGAVLSVPTLHALRDLAVRHDLVVLSDEIYAGMVYEGESPSIATLPDMAERTVVVDGFSKTYAMTGWRLGFGIMPAALATQVAALMNNSNSCTATFVQKAGEAALTDPQDEVRAMVEEFRVRRRLVVDGLRAIPGLGIVPPQGAFYAFPNVERTGFRAAELADRLLEEAGVVTLPGTGFGAEGEGHLRLSCANSQANLREGLSRIGAFLAAHARV